MPRKVYSGLAYDDFEDDYDYSYDDDYDYEVEETGIVRKTKAKQETLKTGVWRCPVCTYDNDNTMSACDICGVLRNLPVKVDTRNDNPSVDGICKDSGASVMAKSLLASLPQQTPTNLLKLGNIHENFKKLNSGFSSLNHQKFNIVPFNFNAPSPDDMVSRGLHSANLKAKENFSTNGAKVTPLLTELDCKQPESSSPVTTEDRHSGSDDSDSVLGNENKPEVSNRSKKSLVLSAKSGKAGNTGKGKAASVSEYNPDTWMIPEKADDELSQLNLAIVGHVDSGKSTLSGRLLHLLGQISQKQMHKYEKEAKQRGKGSFAYAFALDESAEERERGITMNVGVAYFSSNKYQVVLLDSPGHRDFVPNMISGATQADAAILVIDASIGSFEAGIDATGGQTREHAQLIRSFGVDQLIVLVNKMDVVDYSEERFNEIKHKLGAFLRTCGFKDSSTMWIPASAMENQNLVAKPSDEQFSWFKGPCLMEAIDSLQLPARDYSKPLLMPVCDVTKSNSHDQVSACGKLETGAIRTGVKVMVMPSREIATVRSLQRDSQPCNIARAGDNVTINLQGIEANHVMAGGVICHPDFPIEVTDHLELKILVLDITTPILVGSQLEFHIHLAKEVARVVKIPSLLDPKTGKPTRKSPRCLLAKQNALVEVVLQGPVCAREYSNCRALGRVFLRSMGRTVALGIVTRIVET